MRRETAEKWIIGGFVVFMFLFLRSYRLTERMNFAMDQGLFLLRAREIWMNKEITLLGPAASPIVEGRHFFQGPLIYYSLIIMMIAANWNPLGGSIIMIFLSLIGAIFWYLTVKRWLGNITAITATIILTFWPTAIHFSNFLWNPNMLLFLIPIYSYLLTRAIKDKKIRWWFLSGMMGGISLQFHFQVVLIIGLSLMWLLFLKIKLKALLVWAGGIILGYAPLLLFDLRNHFYNLATMWLWLTKGGDNQLKFQAYYFGAFFPIAAATAALVMAKIKGNKLRFFILAIWCIWGSFRTINEKQAEGMPKGWDYRVQQAVVNKITEKGCPQKFNVASSLSGDSRAYDIRYLLTKNNCKPMGVDDYPKTETLFLVAPTERTVENEKIWEVTSLGKFREKRKGILNSKVVFYELEKETQRGL